MLTNIKITYWTVTPVHIFNYFEKITVHNDGNKRYNWIK